MARIGTFAMILAGALLGLPSRAQAQTCSVGPFTSATSLGSIDLAIDRAADGDVVCLRRGNTWSQTGGAALTFSAAHPNTNRVTICSSDATQCTDSTASGANARIAMTDNGTTNAIQFSASSDGYTIKNLDFTGLNTCGSDDTGDRDGAFGSMPIGLRDITFEGGVYDGWPKFAYLDWDASNGEPQNIRFGTCANRMELTNCGLAADPRWTWYGICDNCYFSVWIHSYGPSTITGSQGHIIDFTNQADNAATADNPVIECNLWEFDNGHAGGGDVLRLADGTNAIIRDNTFRRLAGGTNPTGQPQVSGIGFAPHTPTVATQCWTGAEIYRNRFELGAGFNNGVVIQNGPGVKVYNNIFDLTDKTTDADLWGGVISTEAGNGANPCDSNGVEVYNNTIYSPVNGPNAPKVSFCGGATCGLDQKFYNNLIQWNDSDSTRAVVEVADCNNFGTNGANISNNYIYTPNDTTPGLPRCSAQGTFLPGSPWNTAPGFSNVAAGDFGLASTSSPAFGTGAFGVGGAPSPAPTPTPTPSPSPTPTPSPEPAPPASPILLP